MGMMMEREMIKVTCLKWLVIQRVGVILAYVRHNVCERYYVF